MRILVLSDTHVPRSAIDLPKKVYDEIEHADMILHAGDIVEPSLYEKLSTLRPTTAVYGNMDAMKLRVSLKEKEVIAVEKVKIGLIHGYGARGAIMDTVRHEFDAVDCIVFGHSHAPVNLVRDGILFFNPGSPTDRVYAQQLTYGILEVHGSKIEGKIITL